MDKENLIKNIEEGIKATDGQDEYFTGMRNGMRWCLSLIDGKEPKFETVKENNECAWKRHINQRFNRVE